MATTLRKGFRSVSSTLSTCASTVQLQMSSPSSTLAMQSVVHSACHLIQALHLLLHPQTLLLEAQLKSPEPNHKRHLVATT